MAVVRQIALRQMEPSVQKFQQFSIGACFLFQQVDQVMDDRKGFEFSNLFIPV